MSPAPPSARRALALAQKVAESTSQCIVVTDAAGLIESVNPAFTAITGYAPAEAVGRNPRILKSGRHDDAFYDRLYAALACHGVWRGEILNRRKNGDIFPCQTTITAVRDDGGEIIGYISVFSDLTGQKRYQEDLRRASMMLAAQEDLHRVVLDTLPLGAFIKDADGRYLMANEQAAWFAGFAPQDLIGRTDRDIFPPDIAAAMSDEDARIGQSGETRIKEVWIFRGDVEHCLVVRKRGVAIGDERYVVGTIADVTERKRAERRQEDERAILAMIAHGDALIDLLDAICARVERQFRGAMAAIMILDADGMHLRYCAASGLAREFIDASDGVEIGPLAGCCGTAAHTRQLTVIDDLAADARAESLREAAARHGIRACWAMPIMASDDTVLGTFSLYFHAPRQPEAFESPLVEHIAALAAIAIERVRAIDLLRRMATVDMLTGVANRQHFLAIGEHEIARVRRSGQALALCMIDIDRFKAINDTHGHPAGDEVLRRMAAIMKNALRDADVCGRLGGEEFAVLLADAALEPALKVAERLRADIAAARFAVAADVELRVTVSIGICQLRESESLDQIMMRADKALYAAKRGGRDRIVVG